MSGGFFFRRKREWTKFDLYVFLGILLIVVVCEKPELMWLYIFIIVGATACLLYLETHKPPNPLEQPINYTSTVPQEFVKDKNTLGNIHCVAKYFPPQKKIVVMDHPDSRVKTELRSFEVSKDNVADVDKVWKDICSVFDEYTFFDTLFSYIDKNSGVLRLNYINRSEKKTKEDHVIIDYNKLSQPEPVYKAEALVLSEYGDPLINIENLDKKEIDTKPLSSDEYKEFIEMDSILKAEDGKIDVNIANAEKLATLPGVNIVKAKKIIEYRNINGFFKTKDDFCKIAGLKEHFREKVLELITVDKTSKVIVENPRTTNNERIVD